MKQIQFARWGYILISVLLYLSGTIIILGNIRPGKNAVMIGCLILFAYGIIKIIGYFSRELNRLAFQYDFACGILLLILSTFVLIMNLTFHFQRNLLRYLAILILLDSLLCMQIAFDAREFGLMTWNVMLILSALSGTFGVLMLVTSTPLATGLALLGEGAMRHYITLNTVSLVPYRSAEELI